MACALTQGYALDCRKNYGGVKQVWFIELANATLTEVAGIISTITLETGKFWRKYELILETAEATATGTFSREMGTASFAHSVTFPINKMTTSVRDEIKLLAQNRLLIVVEDNNGTKLMYGRTNGMMLETLAAKTGVKYADRNGFELSFTGVEKDTEIEVSAAIVTS